MALALMPWDKVRSSFDEIQREAFTSYGGSIKCLLSYFEHNWMTEINLWNLSGSDSRTNNTCKDERKLEWVWASFISEFAGYHNRVSARLLRRHPCIWDLIKFLQREEKRVSWIMLQWSAGASKHKNYRATAAQSRIKTLYKRYDWESYHWIQSSHRFIFRRGKKSQVKFCCWPSYFLIFYSLNFSNPTSCDNWWWFCEIWVVIPRKNLR